jgi:serine phosphatase RsbU (regulator of sigma subunit)
VMCLPLAWYDGLLPAQRGITSLATIVGITGAGAVASAARRRRERDLADVSTVAEAAQRILLRPVPTEVGPILIAAHYVSASASARIGGDLYEVITTPNGIRLIVADVQGKGLAAARTASVVLGAFREAAHDAANLADVAARLEISLGRQAADEEFVTAVLADVPADGSPVEILNCGHPPPLLIWSGTASFTEPPETGLPLGLTQLASSERKPSAVTLAPGARLLFYTDGISEARDDAGAFYPLDGCGDLLETGDLDAALTGLSDDVVRHVGRQLQDDAALLLVSRRCGSDEAAGSQDLSGLDVPGSSQGFAGNDQAHQADSLTLR